MGEQQDRLKAALAGRYEIIRELGAGGMATVYLAHDARHDRQVAVKVLRPELAVVLGADRFLNEIKVTANLQHPHILALYDSGEADSFLYYVMPYIEGESWRDRIDREQQLPVEEAVRLACEAASALDYAHRNGVVHRDIKPANIMLADGGAQVADFGIALALKAAGGDRLTETGLSLGTPHYMSPEQATGDRDVDARSDIYSLAAVLYESLAGEPPHSGGTVQAVISKLITEDAKPVREHRPSVPVHVAQALEKALSRIPADRFSSAAEFSAALTSPATVTASGHAAMASIVSGSTGQLPIWRAALVGSLLLLTGVFVGRLTTSVEQGDPVTGRFSIPVSSGGANGSAGLTGAPVNTIALSPDGNTIVFVGRHGGSDLQLFVRRIDELEPTALDGTEGGSFPEFSPDGNRIVFQGRGNALYQMPVENGVPILIPAVQAQAGSRTIWLDESHLVLTAPDGSLERVSVSGQRETIASPEANSGETFLGVQTLLPDSRQLLAIATGGLGTANGPVIAFDVDNGERRTLIESPTNAVWYSDGVLLWARPDGVLQGAPFDVSSLATTGNPVTLAEDVRLAVGGPAQVAVSENGSMVYVPNQPFNLMVVDREGRREVVAEDRRFHSPRYSPDGRFLAFDFTQQGSRDVWTLDLRQNALQRLTFENDGHDPVWSPDGSLVTFVSNNGIFRRRADGGGGADSLFIGPTATGVVSFARGGVALTGKIGTAGSWDIGIIDLSGAERTESEYIASGFNEQQAAISPDGRWLAYVSDETGMNEVYVRPFPDGGSKTIVSQGGGAEPMWNPQGGELFYIGADQARADLISASYRTTSGFVVTGRTRLFDASDFEPASPHSNWDVAPDGDHFAFVHLGTISHAIYVMNWTAEVRRADGVISD